MMNPANFRMITLFDNWSASRGQSNDWRADVIYNPGTDGFFREFSFGTRIAKRKASYQHESNGLIALPAGGVPPCAGYLHSNLDQLRGLFDHLASRQPADLLSLYRNQEDTSAIYGKTKFGFHLAAVPVEGTAGRAWSAPSSMSTASTASTPTAC